MTRSIFDPTGGDTERSGSQNLGPDAGNLSHMPDDVTDGKVTDADDAADEDDTAASDDVVDLAGEEGANPSTAPGAEAVEDLDFAPRRRDPSGTPRDEA